MVKNKSKTKNLFQKKNQKKVIPMLEQKKP